MISFYIFSVVFIFQKKYEHLIWHYHTEHFISKIRPKQTPRILIENIPYIFLL